MWRMPSMRLRWSPDLGVVARAPEQGPSQDVSDLQTVFAPSVANGFVGALCDRCCRVASGYRLEAGPAAAERPGRRDRAGAGNESTGSRTSRRATRRLSRKADGKPGRARRRNVRCCALRRRSWRWRIVTLSSVLRRGTGRFMRDLAPQFRAYCEETGILPRSLRRMAAIQPSPTTRMRRMTARAGLNATGQSAIGFRRKQNG